MSGEGNSSANNTILAFAEFLRETMPELNGRVIAVSEMEINRTNVPTMPIAMVALQDVSFRHAEQTNTPPDVVEQIIAEFWYKSNKIKLDGKTESPFYAFYDYKPLMDKVVSLILNWTTPAGFKLKVTRMDLESTELGVHLVFEFFHNYKFCPIGEYDPDPLEVIAHICPKTECEAQQMKV